MPTWTQDDAVCEIFTFKAGLLSAMGHDLKLRVTRFSLTYEDEAFVGEFDGTSIEVCGAMSGGELAPGVLSDKDQAEILSNIHKYVFSRHQADRIRFQSEYVDVDEDAIEGEGSLSIPPNTHDVEFEVDIDDGHAVCEIVLHQPDWSIQPFSALMGALRIQPDVRVRISVPWPS